MAHGKKYQDAAKLVDRERIYLPDEAAELVKQTTYVSFDASVEVIPTSPFSRGGRSGGSSAAGRAG